MNPLDLVERELLMGAVVQLRGAGRLVTGDAGGDFLDAAVAQVLGDAGPPEAVIRYLTGQAGIAHPPFDHLERGLARHGVAQQHILPASLSGGPEQRSLPVVADAGGPDVLIHVGEPPRVCRRLHFLRG